MRLPFVAAVTGLGLLLAACGSDPTPSTANPVDNGDQAGSSIMVQDCGGTGTPLEIDGAAQRVVAMDSSSLELLLSLGLDQSRIVGTGRPRPVDGFPDDLQSKAGEIKTLRKVVRRWSARSRRRRGQLHQPSATHRSASTVCTARSGCEGVTHPAGCDDGCRVDLWCSSGYGAARLTPRAPAPLLRPIPADPKDPQCLSATPSSAACTTSASPRGSEAH